MISEQEIERVVEQSASFRQVILNCRYDPERDRVEFVTSWCTLIVDRAQIPEFNGLSAHDMETIHVSPTGVHIDTVDIDINSAGLITDLSKQLLEDVENSF
jgi:hypothetical protein